MASSHLNCQLSIILQPEEFAIHSEIYSEHLYNQYITPCKKQGIRKRKEKLNDNMQ